MKMNIFDIIKDLDILDIILIIVIIILLYTCISDNFEYYSASEETEDDNYEYISPNMENEYTENDRSDYSDINTNTSINKEQVSKGNNILKEINDFPQNMVNSEFINDYIFQSENLLKDTQIDDSLEQESNTIPSKNNSYFKTVEGMESEQINDENSKEDRHCNVDLIHANWCGFCKKAKPEFDKVKKEHHGTHINETKVFFNDYEEKEHEHLIGDGKKYEVDGFPTLFLTIVENGIESIPIKFNAITYETILENIKKHI